MFRQVRKRLGLGWANRSLRAKGLIVVAIPVTALLVVAPLSYLGQRRSQGSDALVRHTLQVQNDIQGLLVSLLNAETAVRGYLVTGQEQFLVPYDAARKTISARLSDLAAVVQDSPSQIARIRQPDSLALQELGRLEILREIGALSSTDSVRALALLAEDQATMDSLRSVLSAMAFEEDQLLAARRDASKATDRRAFLTILGGTVAGLLGGLLAILLFTRGVVGRVRRTQENANRLADGVA